MPLAAIHRLTWPQDINREGTGHVEEEANGQWGESPSQAKQLRSCCLPPLTTSLSCVCGIFDINSFGQFYKRLSGLTCSSGIHIFH